MPHKINARAINRSRFKVAKRLWGLSFLIKAFIFIIGSVSILVKNSSPNVPLLLLALAIIAELAQWQSDVAKGQSESLLRKLDMQESFQKELSEADKREIAMTIPQKALDRISKKQAKAYFTSKQVTTPRRAVENLVESAWYTKHLCDDMAKICVGAIGILLIVSIFTFAVAMRGITDINNQAAISKVVTSWLLLVFSLGIFKNAWGYHKMHQNSLKTELIGLYILSTSVISEADAIKQWMEYQLNRSAAPLLPDWLWAIKKASLDNAWKTRLS